MISVIGSSLQARVGLSHPEITLESIDPSVKSGQMDLRLTVEGREFIEAVVVEVQSDPDSIYRSIPELRKAFAGASQVSIVFSVDLPRNDTTALVLRVWEKKVPMQGQMRRDASRTTEDGRVHEIWEIVGPGDELHLAGYWFLTDVNDLVISSSVPEQEEGPKTLGKPDWYDERYGDPDSSSEAAGLEPPVSGMTEVETKRFVSQHYSTFAIDTTGAEPMLSVGIRTNGDFSQLDSLGIRTKPRVGNLFMTRIPVALLPVVGSLSTVLSVAPQSPMHVGIQINHEMEDGSLEDRIDANDKAPGFDTTITAVVIIDLRNEEHFRMASDLIDSLHPTEKQGFYKATIPHYTFRKLGLKAIPMRVVSD